MESFLFVSDKSYGDFYGCFALSSILDSDEHIDMFWFFGMAVMIGLTVMIHAFKTKSTKWDSNGLLKKKLQFFVKLKENAITTHIYHIRSNVWMAGIFQPRRFPLLTLSTWMIVISVVWIIEQWALIRWTEKPRKLCNPFRPVFTEFFLMEFMKGNSFL